MFTLTFGFGSFEGHNDPNHQEKELRVTLWWFGCGVWYTNFSEQATYCWFHSRDWFAGFRIVKEWLCPNMDRRG